MNRPMSSTDWNNAEPNPENRAVQLCWKYIVTLPDNFMNKSKCTEMCRFREKIQAFPEREHPRPHRDTNPRPRSSRSPQCLDKCRAFDACDASTSPMFPNFCYFYICLSVLKMYRVVLTVDCQNSVCRNRVCRNSVCLPVPSSLDGSVLDGTVAGRLCVPSRLDGTVAARLR